MSKHSVRYHGGDIFVTVDVDETKVWATFGGSSSLDFFTKGHDQAYDNSVAEDIESCQAWIDNRRTEFTRTAHQRRQVSLLLQTVEAQDASERMGDDA